MHKCHVCGSIWCFFISKNKSYKLQVMQQTKDWVCLCVKDFLNSLSFVPHTRTEYDYLAIVDQSNKYYNMIGALV